MGTLGFYPKGKGAGAEADVVPTLRMCFHSPIFLHGLMLYVLFTFIIPTDLIHKVFPRNTGLSKKMDGI